ncbi:MAG: AsmA family protein [Burkholderiaceae bacterium]
MAAGAGRWYGREHRVARTLLILLIIIVLLFALAEWAGWRFLRTPAQNWLSRSTGLSVTIDRPFRLHLVPRPTVSAGGLEIAAPSGPRTGTGSDAGIAALGPWLLSARYGDLLRSPRKLRSLNLRGGTLRIEQGLFDLRQSSSGSAGRGSVPRLERLELSEPLVVTLRLDEPRIDAKIVLNTAHEGDRTILQADASGQWGERALDLVGRMPDPTHMLLAEGAQPFSVDGEIGAGTLRFEGALQRPLGSGRVGGRLHLSGRSLATTLDLPGIALPSTPPFEITTGLELRSPRVVLDGLQASIGNSRLAADLVFDRGAMPPSLTGSVDAERLLLADLGPAIGQRSGANRAAEERPGANHSGENHSGANHSGANRTAAREGRVLPDDSLDVPNLRKMQADLALRIASLDLGSSWLRDIRDLSTHVRLQNGALALESLAAQAAGGSVKGSSQLSASRFEEQPVWTLALEWRDVDLARWLTGAAAGKLGGLLDGRINVRGDGDSTAAILATLEGRFRARASAARISHTLVEMAGLDIAQAIGVSMESNDEIPVSCLLADLPIANGIARAEPVVVNTPDSVLYATGQMRLVDERLDLRVVASPKDWSLLSLRSPLEIGGSFANPQVNIDTGQLGTKVLGALALAAVNPIAGLLPLMDYASEDAKQGCAQALEAVREQAGRAEGGQ